MQKKAYKRPDFELIQFIAEDFAVDTSSQIPGVDSNENETSYPTGWTPNN